MTITDNDTIYKNGLNSQTGESNELICLLQIREIVEPVAGKMMQSELVAEIKRLKTIVDNLPDKKELKIIFDDCILGHIMHGGQDINRLITNQTNAIYNRIMGAK